MAMRGMGGIAIAVGLAASIVCPCAAQAPPVMAFIVHRSNEVDNLSRAELREILLLESQSWPNRKKITVVMRDAGDAGRVLVLRSVCGMNDADLERHVQQAIYQGTVVSPPRTISTSDGMRRFVFNVPGAIGYVPLIEADSTVKVLRIDGKLPGEPGYPVLVANPPAGRRP